MKTRTWLALAWGMVLLAVSEWPAAAFYDPHAGRWLTRDPIQEAGGVNIYSFANNLPQQWIDAYGNIPLDTALDVAVFTIDLVTGAGLTSLALDVAALAIPYVPNPRAGAIITKVINGQSKDFELVKSATLKRAEFLHVPALTKGNKLTIAFEYQGRLPNLNNSKWDKHFWGFAWTEGRAKNFTAQNPRQSLWRPQYDDTQVRAFIDEALQAYRSQFKQMTRATLDGFEYDARFPFGKPHSMRSFIGYSKGDCTGRIKLHVDTHGTIHAFPIPEK